ncbi:MAG: ACT domain-containing protein [Bacillota bacterium]|nr:ACT domain-containing protein [Bacillota bacterium]
MEIKLLPHMFTVCKIEDVDLADLSDDFTFLSKTDDEISLVAKEENVAGHCLAREDGWRGLRIAGTMDFTMIGVISRLTSVLAAEDIPVFVISTFDTDYIFIKDEDLSKALYVLEDEYKTVVSEVK